MAIHLTVRAYRLLDGLQLQMGSARVRLLLTEKVKVLPPEKVKIVIAILGPFKDIDFSPPPLLPLLLIKRS